MTKSITRLSTLCLIIACGCADESGSDAAAAPLAAAAGSSAPVGAASDLEVGVTSQAVTSCRTQELKTEGGHAGYTECSINGGASLGGSMRLDGWVKDTDADGRCAQVYAYDSEGVLYESNRACPDGEREVFHWEVVTSDFLVYLHVF